jgi:lysophospholipase
MAAAAEQAPWFGDVAQVPGAADAPIPFTYWVKASDGIRLRVAHWPAPATGPARGSVILLPGRTEYVEKYALVAQEVQARGFATLAIDWRGQGLSDRLLPDAMSGHVGDFAEYQRDLDAMLALAVAEALPRPWHLMSHSMGGCIALRALSRGLPFATTVFSAPMWGIAMAAWLRPAAQVIGATARLFGQHYRYTPTTSHQTYLVSAPFAGNLLTSDPEMFNWMRAQITAHPELALGGPSLAWLHAALRECAALSRQASPDLPCLTVQGTAERIVDTLPIRQRMSRWHAGRFELFTGAAHEVMMETPAARARFFDLCCETFSRAG